MKKKLLVLLIFSATIVNANARTIKVNTTLALQEAIANAKPGDRIIVADGRYETSTPLIISASGTKEKHLIIESETSGGAEIYGSDGFDLVSPCTYVEIKGFLLTHSTGKFRIEAGVTHCIISRNIFECLPSTSQGSRPYLSVSGDENEISYNTFRNKKDEGQMISVQGPGGDRMAKNTWIHHNYFHDFPSSGHNNCSAIQIGLSGRSMDSAFCVVEYNLFERTEGENEGAICHKSCKNIIRFNTFGERSEECSIRHGNGSEVYGNFFINTTGLRFSGDDHLIYGNYFRNCSKAIVCQNGDGEVKEGSKLTCHDRPDRVIVAGNTIVDCKTSFQMPARTNGYGATGISFTGNLIRTSGPVSINGKYPGAIWKDNIIWNTGQGDIPATGYRIEDIKVIIPANNEEYPSIPKSNKILTKEEVGAKARTLE